MMKLIMITSMQRGRILEESVKAMSSLVAIEAQEINTGGEIWKAKLVTDTTIINLV